MKKVIATLILLCMHAYNHTALIPKSASSVQFISMTPENAEETILNRLRQNFRIPNVSDTVLIGYCMTDPAFSSLLDHPSFTVEINTSRANALGIEKDTTATYQEFSQRYADPTKLTTQNPETRIDEMFLPVHLLKQHSANPDEIAPALQEELQRDIKELYQHTLTVYDELLKSPDGIKAGIALECARFVLPQSTRTRIYKKNSLLGWINYFKQSALQTSDHDLSNIAQQCQKLFTEKLPLIGMILNYQQQKALSLPQELAALMQNFAQDQTPCKPSLSDHTQPQHQDALVKLRHITPNAEQTIAQIARVSNPKGQFGTNYAKLLKYCWDQDHVSIFEQADLSVQIATSLAIAHQIQRHRSMKTLINAPNLNNLDEPDALQRMFTPIELRSQDKKDRQNSIDNVPATEQERLQHQITQLQQHSLELYRKMIAKGITPRSAANILPLNTRVNLTLTGNVRSFLTYINSRRDPKTGTQKEHRDVAAAIQEIMKKELPIISESAGWFEIPTDAI